MVYGVETNSQRLYGKIHTLLDHIICQECHDYLSNPVTLPCGHSICISCLSLTASTKLLSRPIGECPFPKCRSVNLVMSELRIDVTLTKIVKAILANLTQFSSLKQFNESEGANDILSTTAQFLKNILPEFECHICYLVVYNPITTTCGHTFCQDCLLRTVDHSTNCPICRGTISYPLIKNHPKNHIILQLAQVLFPEAIYRRQTQLQEKINLNGAVSILIGDLVFPHILYYIHVYEPPYRLLIRRCLETESKQFGIIPRNHKGTELMEYGTLVSIESVQTLSDGRYLIQVKGIHRFKILEHTNAEDGYHIASIEFNEDLLHTAEVEAEDTNIEEMMHMVKEFIRKLGKGYPQLFNRLTQLYGPSPQALVPFSYWASCVIPIEDHEKYKLLCVNDSKLRLSMVVRWIEAVRTQWGYISPSCSIM